MAGLFFACAASPADDRFHHSGNASYTRYMEQQHNFDIDHFEQRVERLLSAYSQLRDDYRKLQTARQAETERNRALQERLNGVIERIRALETEADSV